MRHRYVMFWGILLLSLFINGPSRADGFWHLTRKEGLSSNRTYQMVEDKQGFMWISSEAGIDRFDGRKFVHYPLEKLDEIAGMGYHFYYLVTDANDNIYVVANRCYVYKLNRLKDKFELLHAFDSYNGKYISSVFLDKQNQLLMGTHNDLIIYDFSKRKFIHSPIKSTVFSIMSYNNGYLLGLTNKIVWVSSDFKKIKPLGVWNKQLGKNIRIRALFYDRLNQRIWFGTQDAGLYFFDLKTRVYREGNYNKELQKYPVWDITGTNDTTMIVGTDGAGLLLLDLRNKTISKQYLHNPDNRKSISSNVIYDILVSRKNGLYFITTDISGINVLNPKVPKFHILKRQKSAHNSLINNVVHSVVELSPEKIAFGTDKGVSIWDRKTNHWEQLGYKTGTGRNKVVTAMTSTNNGSLWVGYFLNNLKIYGPDEKLYNTLPKMVITSRNPKAINFDAKQKTLWISRAGPHIRLISYNLNTRTLDRYAIPEVTDLTSYSNRKLLVSTRSGLYVINKKTTSFLKYNLQGKNINRITCLFVDSKHRIWVGSDGGGLAQITIEGKVIRIFDENSGLVSNHVLTIEEDNQGILWVATAGGLSRVNPENNTIWNYFASDSAVPGEFRLNASCKTHDGIIIMGGTEGATIFNPANMGRPYISNNLIFTDFYLDQKKISEFPSLLHKPLNQEKSLTLKYNQNSFSIAFTDVDFIHPEQARYSWKLQGFDKNWSFPSPTGKATYSNLPPGNYIFRVRLKPYTISGQTPLERDIQIEITPPIWKTSWAFMIYAILIFALILTVLYFNKLSHDIKSARERLRFLVNIAHEIKTPLTLIQAPITDVIQDSKDNDVVEKLNTAMANVKKLQNKISQFLDFKRMDQIKNIHLEKIDAVGFIKRKIFAFKLLAEKENLQLNFECALKSLEVYCDTELLDKILNNLISNAIKYNNRGGFINIRIIKEIKFWTIEITDSGIGIPKKEQRKIFSLFFRASNAKNSKTGSGVGLVLAYDMVNVLNGKLTFKSRENQGTTFTVKLPIGEPDIHSRIQKHFESKTEKPEETDEIIEQTDEKKFKVLVAEDDDDLRKYIKNELSKFYQVIECSNGQEALIKVQQLLPDLVLSDFAMPRMNGRQLCMNIKSNASTSHIPFIMLSGLNSKEVIIQGLSTGADDYITKPFDFSILMAKIKTLIDNRKVLKEKFINSSGVSLDMEFKNDFDKSFVKSITTIIEENLSDPELSIRQLYTSAGMSRTAFYHKLKSLVDLSPAEFIRMIRLNHAKVLLKRKRYNINEIAYRCGFSDAKYFSTSFKRQFGKSPSSYQSEQED